MHRLVMAAGILVLAVTLAGCGGGSKRASRDCFTIWNDGSNQARQTRVSGRFSVANVTEWRAQPGSGSLDVEWRAAPRSGTANLGGPGSQGCGYLFHTSKRFLSLSAERKGRKIRWGVPPAIRGSWSQRQQSSAPDNAAVADDGRLVHLH